MSDIQVKGTTFSDFVDFVHNTETVITPYLAGFVNIEGGHLSIAGKLFPECGDCDGYSATSVFVECSSCGRNKDEYIHIRAGYGDGIYPVFELAWDGKVLGTISFCDGGSKFANDFFTLPGKISDGSVKTNAAMEFFWEYFDKIDRSLHLDYLATIRAEHDTTWSTSSDPFGTYYFADSGVGQDPTGSLVTVKDIRLGSQDVYIFSERAPENLNVLIPLVVLTLDPELSQDIGLPSGKLEVDTDEEATNWGNSTVFSQIGGNNATAAVAINIQYESALLGTGFWDELSELDHMLITISWRVLYDILTKETNSTLDEIFSEFTAERISLIHRMRGLVTLAQTYYNSETGEEGPAFKELQSKFNSSSSVDSPTLPKPGSGIGGTQKIGGETSLSGNSRIGGSPSGTLARFCSSCGTAFTDEAHRFCGQCGAAR